LGKSKRALKRDHTALLQKYGLLYIQRVRGGNGRLMIEIADEGF
jgi:mRNA-degrading endonuclease RelE of RelBE toxin-antitoxin system